MGCDHLINIALYILNLVRDQDKCLKDDWPNELVQSKCTLYHHAWDSSGLPACGYPRTVAPGTIISGTSEQQAIDG